MLLKLQIYNDKRQFFLVFYRSRRKHGENEVGADNVSEKEKSRP